MKSDLGTMRGKKLWCEYVISHFNDKEAFYLYVDALKSGSSSPEDIEHAVMNYVEQKQINIV